MDGFVKNDRIFVLAATNFPEGLDPALLRAGRFDRIISIPIPSFKGRTQLIKYYLNKIKHKGVNIGQVARKTVNFTGADIKNLVNMAAINAVRNRRKSAE